MSEEGQYKGRYCERYRGLPAEIRLQIWKLLVPKDVMLTKVTMHSDKASNTPIDEIYTDTHQSRLVARCKFNKSLGLALLAIDRTIRAEVLPLFKLKVNLHHHDPPSLLERNNFIQNSPIEVSRLITGLQAGLCGRKAVSAYIISFFNNERVGVFRDIQFASIEILLHSLTDVELLINTLIARIHPTSSALQTPSKSGRRVLELLIHAGDILFDFWTAGEDCEVEESIKYKRFQSRVKKTAASVKLNCEVQVFEDVETGEHSRLYFHLSRMS